jgi:hypothetical protein
MVVYYTEYIAYQIYSNMFIEAWIRDLLKELSNSIVKAILVHTKYIHVILALESHLNHPTKMDKKHYNRPLGIFFSWKQFHVYKKTSCLVRTYWSKYFFRLENTFLVHQNLLGLPNFLLLCHADVLVSTSYHSLFSFCRKILIRANWS